MLTFTSDGPSTVRAATSSHSIVAFPEKNEPAKATLTLFSHPEEAPQAGTISWPGEYDIQGISVKGVGHKEGAEVSYVIEIEGKRIAFLCSPLHDWTDHELEVLGDIDVLVLPADDAKLAQKLIDEIDPRVLIPVQGEDKSILGDVLKICGAQDTSAEKEYKLKSLPAEGRVVVVLG